MAPTRHRAVAQEKERFPTEWALYGRDEHLGEQVSHQSEDARCGGWALGWAPGPPLEAIGRPARQSARLDRQTRGAA
jgi:hypothetical protein